MHRVWSWLECARCRIKITKKNAVCIRIRGPLPRIINTMASVGRTLQMLRSATRSCWCASARATVSANRTPRPTFARFPNALARWQRRRNSCDWRPRRWCYKTPRRRRPGRNSPVHTWKRWTRRYAADFRRPTARHGRDVATKRILWPRPAATSTAR